MYRVGDILLAINDDNVLVGWSEAKVESVLKSLPRGNFRLTVMAPPKDVSGPQQTAPAKVSAKVSSSTPKPSLEPHSQPTSTPDTAKPSLEPHSQPISTPDTAKPSLAQPISTADTIVHLKSTVSNRGSVHEEGIIEVILERERGKSLGFLLEGGVGTEIIHIKELMPNSPATRSGLLSQGDQIVMVGENCLVGKSLREANLLLEQAPSPVKMVLQRKMSPKISESRTIKPPDYGFSTTEAALPIGPTGDTIPINGPTRDTIPRISLSSSCSMSNIPKTEEESTADHSQAQIPNVNLSSAVSTDNLPTQFQSQGMTKAVSTILPQSSGESKPVLTKASSEGELNLSVEPVTSVPEESITVRLRRGEGEKFGLKVAGGRDHPSLHQVHVSDLKLRT